MTPFARMLHISDLHFPKDFKEKERSNPRNSLYARSLVTSFRKLKSETAPTGGIDLLVGTGDISTDGTREALEIARDFIDAGQVRATNHCLTSGLSMGPARRLIVPGNHDRYVRIAGPLGFQGRSDKLESVFSISSEYPYVRAYRRAAAAGATPPKTPALVFFVFDSTPSPYALQSVWRPVKYFRERPAIGRLESGDCERMVHLSEDLLSGEKVEGVGGGRFEIEDYENCVKIAVLHHHPIEIKVEREWLDIIGVTTMENDGEFIDACFRAGIDIVLFGHEHLQDYQRLSVVGRPVDQNVFGKRPHDIHFFCCPSTLAHYAKNQGFYLFGFGEAEFEARLFEWSQVNFVEVKGKSNLRGEYETWPKTLPYRVNTSA